MPNLVFNGTNFDSCLGTQTIHASSSNSLTTTLQFGATFTAPNTSNAVTGVVLFVNTFPNSTSNIEVVLQESGVDVASGIAITTELKLGFNYIRFETPFVFTTTAANAYRVGVRGTLLNSGTVARNGGNSIPMLFVTTDDTVATPTTSDDVLVFGFHDSGLTPQTLTLSGTSNSWGTGKDKAIPSNSSRSMGAALTIGNGGTVVWDTTASAKLGLKGAVFITDGGVFNMSGNQADGSIVSTLEFEHDTANANYGIITANAAVGGRFICEGKPVATHAVYASGVGTAASPVVTSAAHGFSVGDEVIFAGNAYNTNQLRFVITVPSATTLVLSTTAGGSEVALDNIVPATSRVANLTRNCVITNTTTVRGFWVHALASRDDCSFEYCRFEYPNTVSGRGIQLGTSPVALDGLVLYHNAPGGRGSIGIAGSTEFNYGTITLVNTTGSNYFGQSGLLMSGSNATVDCLLLYAAPGSANCCAALSLNATSVNNVIEEFHSYGANGGNSVTGYALGLFGAGNRVRNATINASRRQAIMLSTCLNNRIVNGRFGELVSNGDTAIAASNTLNTALFSRCTFGSDAPLTNYTNALEGTEIRFHEMDGDNDKHRWYTNRGSSWSSGAGLTDTTVRTADSLALALKPEDAVAGQVWETLVPAVPNSQCGVFGYCFRNATFSSGVFKVELFLPGSDVADASFTFATTTDEWLPFNISTLYTGAETRFATVRFTAVSAASGAIGFIDDLYDAGTGNKVAGLDAWHEGKPSPVIVAADFSAVPALVWGYSDQTTSADTMGKRQVTPPVSSAPSAADIADAVWDEAIAAHDTAGSTGKRLIDAMQEASYEAAPTAEGVADAVWDEAVVDHQASGSTGKRLIDAMQEASYEAAPAATTIRDAILDAANGIETGLTPREALRLIAAVLAGKVSNASGPNVVIRSAVSDDANRIVATVDDDGNRTHITYELGD